MSKPNFMQECYDRFVTPESRHAVEHMSDEDCGVIILNKKKSNMKTIPTKEQVLDAVQTHKTLYRAAYTFGVTSPTFKRWMDQYGITMDNLGKAIAVEEEPVKAEPQPQPWYKRLFCKR